VLKQEAHFKLSVHGISPNKHTGNSRYMYDEEKKIDIELKYENGKLIDYMRDTLKNGLHASTIAVNGAGIYHDARVRETTLQYGWTVFERKRNATTDAELLYRDPGRDQYYKHSHGDDNRTQTTAVTFTINLLLTPKDWPTWKGDSKRRDRHVGGRAGCKNDALKKFEFEGGADHQADKTRRMKGTKWLLSERKNTVPLMMFQIPYEIYRDACKKYWNKQNDSSCDHKWSPCTMLRRSNGNDSFMSQAENHIKYARQVKHIAKSSELPLFNQIP